MKTMEEAFSWEPCILKHPRLWDCGLGLTRYEVANDKNERVVKATDGAGNVLTFKNRKAAAIHFQRSHSAIGEAIRKGCLVHNKYRLEELSNA